jgi:multiple sugar transport system ATP-binding protein
MNFLDFDGMIGIGGASIDLGGKTVAVPVSRQGAEGRLTLGVRPENIHFSDASTFRGRVIATEYLGTTQVVTLNTAHGDVKVRTSSAQVIRPGETVGLEFDARTLTLFGQEKGQALLSEANEGVLGHG